MFFVIRAIGRGSRGRTGQRGGGATWLKLWGMCFALAVPICLIAALFHAVAHTAPPAMVPQLVTFGQGSYVGGPGTGNPASFEVTADNGNATAVTVHKVTVEFTDAGTGQEIAQVTEPAGSVVIQAGETQTLSGPAPTVVVNAAGNGAQIGVTVTGWS